jgi:hypothetical protein
LLFFKTLTADDAGHRDSFPSKYDMMMKTVDSVTYQSECPKENCLMIVMEVDRTYELTFTSEWEVHLDLVKGIGNCG